MIRSYNYKLKAIAERIEIDQKTIEIEKEVTYWRCLFDQIHFI